MLLECLQKVKSLTAQALQHCSRLGSVAQQQLHTPQKQTLCTKPAPLVQLAAIKQQQMITGQPHLQQPERAAVQHDVCGNGTCCHQALSGISEHRSTHSTFPSGHCRHGKSAKRQATEALLAAHYGSGLPAPSSASLKRPAAMQQHAACFTSGASSAGADQKSSQLTNKKQKSMLTVAIDKLSDDEALRTPHTANSQHSQPVKQQFASTGQVGQQRASSPLTQQQPSQRQHMQQHEKAQADSSVPGPAAGTPGTTGSRHSPVVPAEASVASQYQATPALTGERASVMVHACGQQCHHPFSHGWCHSQVQLPSVDWSRVLEADMPKLPSMRLAPGYNRHLLPSGLQVLVVENHAHLAPALAQLRSSMQDSVIAIDLEWRPQFGKGFTPVAMMQLASSRLAVLVRTCHMGYKLPGVLRDFLKDPKVQLLGFSWESADESKMQSTFGVGSKSFGSFLDLQQVANGLGYHNFGLSRLVRQVLGMHMPKNKKVTMSNWETSVLSGAQVKYAALDVLVAGQVFRALRLWHSSPSPCEVCHQNLGVISSSLDFQCSECDKTNVDIKAHLHHCERSGHKPRWTECQGCGCARELV